MVLVGVLHIKVKGKEAKVAPGYSKKIQSAPTLYESLSNLNLRVKDFIY